MTRPRGTRDERVIAALRHDRRGIRSRPGGRGGGWRCTTRAGLNRGGRAGRAGGQKSVAVTVVVLPPRELPAKPPGCPDFWSCGSFQGWRLRCCRGYGPRDTPRRASGCREISPVGSFREVALTDAVETAREIVNAFYARKSRDDVPADHMWLQRQIVAAINRSPRPTFWSVNADGVLKAEDIVRIGPSSDARDVASQGVHQPGCLAVSGSPWSPCDCSSRAPAHARGGE